MMRSREISRNKFDLRRAYIGEQTNIACASGF
jgi:hypothetical protein